MTKHGTRVRAIVSDMGSKTTVHGLSRIVEAGSKYRRITWTCFVLTGLIISSLHLSTMVLKYLDYPMVEVSGVRQDIPNPFPSVTICNIAAVSGKEKEQRAVRRDKYSVFERYVYMYIMDIPQELMVWLNSPQGGYENFPSYMKSHARTYRQFVLQCTYNRQRCSEENFTMHFDGANYYYCFTFNSGSGSDSGLTAQRTGAEYGLSLILAMDNDIAVKYDWYNTESNIAGGAGVRVVIHEHNTLPFPAEQGFDIPPGYTTSVSLRASLRTRLPKPHGNCSNDDNRQSVHTKKQTLFSCLQLCQQEVIINECDCKTSALPEPEYARNVTYCGVLKGWLKAYEKMYTQLGDAYEDVKRLSNSSDNTTDEELKKHKYIFDNMNEFLMELDSDVALQDISCMESVRNRLRDDRSYEKNCECQIPCSEIQYKTSTSYSYWPLEMYQYMLVRKLQRDNPQAGNSFLFDALRYFSRGMHFVEKEREQKISMPWEEKTKLQYAAKLVRQNVIRLNVYVEDLTIMELKQVEAYGIEDLASDIGGSLGLWMGISVLSCLELFELIIRLVGIFWHRKDKVGT